MRTALLSSFIVAAACLPARAASSEWAESEGARVRVVTAGEADGSGTLRGALEIELSPGWKTYWRDPGDTGVPPRVAVSGGGASLADMVFPVPHRFNEEGAVWAGYAAPVDFGLRIDLEHGKATGPVTADVFLGICQKICIPFQARLTVDPGENAGDPDDAALVAHAFEQGPGPARAGFRLAGAEAGEEALTLVAELPSPEAEAELFVAAPQGYSFGPPRREAERGGKAVFSVPVYDRPETGKGAAAYTLVQGGQAVEGTVVLP